MHHQHPKTLSFSYRPLSSQRYFFKYIFFNFQCREYQYFQLDIATNKNMKTRNRQFNDARNKNLAQSSITIPAHSTYNAFSHQQNITSNQSFTSSFIKKNKPDVCISCVNKKIATQKKIKSQNEKKKEIEHFRAQMEYRNSQRDIGKEQRQKMVKQASEYNRSMIGKSLKQTQSEKLLDSRYISQQLAQDYKQLQSEREHLEKQKEAELQYRKELYLQYIKEEERKKQQKNDRKKPEVNQLNLKYYDKTKMIKEYSTELKKQINHNRLKTITQRQQKVQEERKLLEKSQSQFLKYTEFLNPEKQANSINPEVFEDLKLMDYAKKAKKIEEIEMKNKERQEQLRREKQLLKSETERSLQSKRDYERELKQQMTQKSLKAAAERQQALKFPWRVQKYTEDLVAESRIVKPCEECRHSYDQKCLM